MNTTKYTALLCWVIVAAATGFAQQSATNESAEADYTRTINDRANKIVATLGISDPAKASSVRDIIAGQYRALRNIHDPRDAALKAAKVKFAGDKSAADSETKKIQDEAKAGLDKLHGQFLAKLSTELTRGQVDKVKDGMTYGVLEVTYNAYMKMFPELKDDQKAQIKSWLVEARELAMDQGSSGEKHAVFGKYKGRINNYLSKAGYDLKKGEQNLRK